MGLNGKLPAETASEATRHQLVQAAAEVFAQAGFRAATVREICRRAGANIAAVNYHFGDKEALYAEVLKHALGEARERYPLTLGLSDAPTPEERLRALVRAFLLRIFEQGPHRTRGQLILREMVEPTGALDELVEAELKPTARYLQSIVQALLGPNADPKSVQRCGLSVVGQVVFYNHCRPVLDRLFPGTRFTPEEVRQLGDHIAEFSLAGIARCRARRAARRSRAVRGAKR